MVDDTLPTRTAPPSAEAAPRTPRLRRQVGIAGATMMGLGSILGTGIFVSIGVAAGAAGPSVVLAIAVAAVVAVCNGLSSAQLAANHPVSGGTYEYGYRWLRPSLGFTAGWMFLCAKTASAATAALGFSGYAIGWLGVSPGWHLPLAAATTLGLTLLVLSGIRRSSMGNMLIVSVTLLSLVVFVGSGLAPAIANGTESFRPFFAPASPDETTPWGGFLEACALMFVAFTGYGRIATLGEEIKHPRKNIPLAIIVTLLISTGLYVAVAWVAIGVAGSASLAEATAGRAAPLEQIASTFSFWGAAPLVAVGAMTAMLGVLLNLLLGLSRVMLAMGRRGDIPRCFARLDRSGSSPYLAVAALGLGIGLLAMIGNVKTTWSFSAFTVLIYYALTNLAATRLTDQQRLYPRWIPWIGLLACLFLAFWVDSTVWMVGLGLIAAGLIWQRLWQANR